MQAKEKVAHEVNENAAAQDVEPEGVQQGEEENEYAGLSHNEMLGKRGEDAARAYLIHNGFEILDKN